MVKAADRAAEIGADVLQVFSDNPTAWRRRSSPPAELGAFRRRLELLRIGPLAIHASYLINLAGPDDEFHEKSVAVLTQELITAQAYGAAFVNVHIGSHRGTGPAEGARRAAVTVARAFEAAGERSTDPVLALENSAGGGSGLGATCDELAMVLEAIEATGVPGRRIGLCLDTAHLWSAGHDISNPERLDRVLDTFESQIGLARVAMVHLNDSRSELGSGADRHQHIGVGQIGAAGLGAVLRSPRLFHAPCYLETPGMDDGYDAVNMARCRDLLDGRTLADLPAEALTMPGSRSRTAPAREPGDEDEGVDSRGRRRQLAREDASAGRDVETGSGETAGGEAPP